MDSSSIIPITALLIGAIVIVVILLRVMRARQRKAAELPHPEEARPLTVDQEEYLDSSHIGGPLMPGGDPRQSDAAARAAAALRNKKR